MQFVQNGNYIVLKNSIMQRIIGFRDLAHHEEETSIKYAILNIAFYLEDSLSISHPKDYFKEIQNVLNNNLQTLQKTSLCLSQQAQSLIDFTSSCLMDLHFHSDSLFNLQEH